MDYDSLVSELEKIDCLTEPRNASYSFGPDAKRFYIRGTKYNLVLKKTFDYSSINNAENIQGEVLWFFKRKRKNRYKRVAAKQSSISFEDILDSTLISQEAKKELLYHIDIFC